MTILDNGKPDRKLPKLDLSRQRDDPASFTMLSDKEKAAIREKAKFTVANEIKDREEKALLEAYIKEEREQVDPSQQLVPIYLNLAGHSNYIMLDGAQYFHERLYQVTPSVFAVLAEQQARGWAHEEETEVRDVKTRRRSRPPPHVGVTNFSDNRRPRDIVTSAGQLQGASPASMLGIGQ